MSKKVLSIVVPMFNEQEVLSIFFATLIPILEECATKYLLEYEIVCINDGSRDQTASLLDTYHRQNARIKIIHLSRNFGKEAALTAGLDFAQGDAVIPIDVDLQDPPETILEMLLLWQQGADVVVGLRHKERGQDTLLKKSTSGLFYWFFNKISFVKVHAHAGDFRLLDRKVVDALKELKEANRFMKGLFSWVGFKEASVAFERKERAAGQTKWNYWRLWNFALDGITNFSTLPLRIWTYFGALTAFSAFVYLFYIIVKTLLFGTDVPGYASLITILLFSTGIQLLGLGIIGEYVGRIYMETKKRPIYLVRTLVGLLPIPANQPQRSSACTGQQNG